MQETLPYQEHFEKKIVTKIARTAEVCHCQTDSSAAPLVVMATFVFVIGVLGVVTLTKNVVLQFASVLMCKIVS